MLFTIIDEFVKSPISIFGGLNMFNDQYPVFNTSHFPNYHNKIKWVEYIFMGLVMILVWSCASVKPPQEHKDWACDEEADAAVGLQNWDHALAGHLSLLKEDPDNCLAIYHLGYIYGKMGRRTEEMVHYERAVKCGLDRDDRLFYNLGMVYGEMNFTEKALASFEQAIRLNCQNAENHFGLGMTAQAAGRTEKALSALLKAVDLDPHHWEAHIILARIYLDQGRLASARIHLEALRKGLPNNEEVTELWQTYEDRKMTSYTP